MTPVHRRKQARAYLGQRRIVALLVLGPVALAACPARRESPRARAVAPELAEIVRLEGSRIGAERLAELAASADAAVRRRALRALGRQGDPESAPIIAQGLTDPAIRAAAAEALGLLGASSASPALVATVEAALDSGDQDPWLIASAAALGRIGDELDAPVALARLFAVPDPAVRAAAARALGALGHRKIALSADVIDAVAEATKDPDARVRHAAVYALMRAALRGPGAVPPVVARALGEALADAEAETRALAIRGLATTFAPRPGDASSAGGAHGAVPAATGPIGAIMARLNDADWRVRVQAVRALAGPGSEATMRGEIAAWLEADLARAVRAPATWASADAHPRLEALAVLAPFAKEPALAAVFAAAHDHTAHLLAQGPGEGQLALSTANCAAQAGLAHAGKSRIADVLGCGGPTGEARGLPEHLRVQVALGLVGDKVFADGEARELFQKTATHPDPRVRGAAIEAAAAWLPDAAAVQVIDAALGRDRDLMVAAIAAEAIGRLSATDVATTKLLPSFYAKIAARLRAGAEPEAMLSFISALCGAPGTPAPPAAFDPVRAEAVRAAVDHPSAVVRQAARTCLTERTGEDPGPGAPTRAAPATPADPTALLGRRVTWTVTTTRGDLRISLDPDTAPWNVATLTTLAQRGAFDGTLWHRVVADFVVQGGDPTGSGWGGPGFTVPAEPSLAPYDRGAIGIADAGRDTGGSQWFIMHSTAPHLEQRYTWIGHVLAGQDVVDRLLVGDRIVRVQVQIDDAPLDAAPNPSPVDRP